MKEKSKAKIEKNSNREENITLSCLVCHVCLASMRREMWEIKSLFFAGLFLLRHDSMP